MPSSRRRWRINGASLGQYSGGNTPPTHPCIHSNPRDANLSASPQSRCHRARRRHGRRLDGPAPAEAGQSVVLVDRRGAGEETSYGNTGIIQREGVVPYPFPRDIALDGAIRVQHAHGSQPALERAAQDRALAVPLLAVLDARAAGPDGARCAAAGGALHGRARGADGGCRHPRHDAAHGLPAPLSLCAGDGGRDRQGRGLDARPTASTSRRSMATSSPNSSRICGIRSSAAC